MFQLLLTAMLAAPGAMPQDAENAAPQLSQNGQPIEIGTVRWLRDLDAGLAASAQSGKPILLLFQEVPG